MGPQGHLWFDIEDPEMFSSAELEYLGISSPDPEDIPIFITIENASEWRSKIKKAIKKRQEADWGN